MKKSAFLLPAVVVAVVAAVSSVFIVDEREKVLVLQFGQIVKVQEAPGLGFKIPLIQDVVRYDDRILSRELEPLEVTPSDDRRLVVDAFARYRITDVERFRQAVGDGGEAAAARRLDSILRAETREVLGSVTSNDILSTDRAGLMLRIRNGAIAEANALGLQVIDVRLKRTDLPPDMIPLTPQQHKLYQHMLATADVRADGLTNTLMNLRRVCMHPALFRVHLFGEKQPWSLLPQVAEIEENSTNASRSRSVVSSSSPSLL